MESEAWEFPLSAASKFLRKLAEAFATSSLVGGLVIPSFERNMCLKAAISNAFNRLGPVLVFSVSVVLVSRVLHARRQPLVVVQKNMAMKNMTPIRFILLPVNEY